MQPIGGKKDNTYAPSFDHLSCNVAISVNEPPIVIDLQGSLCAKAQALYDWMAGLRLHHWLKNLLIFVPLLAAHRVNAFPLWVDALKAFLCFGLCASSAYILNDLLDLRDDRRHPTKRFRSFAAGRLSLKSGIIAIPILFVAAMLIALLQLPPAFSGCLAAYCVLTTAYSAALKRYIVVDVIILATLYTLRIVAGGVAVGIPLSVWLILFSIFLFVSLALVKRHTELFDLSMRGSREKIRGRGYRPGDLPIIAALGATSGYLAALVLALYIRDAGASRLYRHPEFLWLACPLLLFWITRVWVLARRGGMHADPVIFAVCDRVSLLIMALTAMIMWAAT